MANLVLSYIGPSGQTNFVGLIQRLSDGYFYGSGNGLFSNSLQFYQKQIYLPEVSGMPGLYKTSIDGTSFVDDEYNYYVYNSGVPMALGNGNFWMKGGIEAGPSGIANTVWDENILNHLSNNTFGSGFNNINKDVYIANIKFLNDSTVPNNDYSVTWFKNGNVQNSGLVSNSAISVYNTIDGTALFSNRQLTYFAPNTSIYRSTSVVVSGHPYVAIASGVIDGSTRVWSNLVGLDYL